MTIMAAMTDPVVGSVTAGVDTHRDFHVVAALDWLGRLHDVIEVPNSPAGHAQAVQWLASIGQIDQVGVEGTGSYGVGLSRYLQAGQIRVVEVDRPDRRGRRMHGKTDATDAIAAARAVQSGSARGIPKSRDGQVEAIRVLRVARNGAIKARSAAANQLKSVRETAPEPLRSQLIRLTTTELVARCAAMRPALDDGVVDGMVAATKMAMRSIARRYQDLKAEIALLDAQLDPLTLKAAPQLRAQMGVGPDVAGQLLVTAGDNPHRLHSEAAFARLCGVAPIPADSGQTQGRHRLHRGGDRQANAALYRVTLNRLRHDPRTQTYKAERIGGRHTTKTIIRSLKRIIARDLYTHLMADFTALHTPA